MRHGLFGGPEFLLARDLLGSDPGLWNSGQPSRQTDSSSREEEAPSDFEFSGFSGFCLRPFPLSIWNTLDLPVHALPLPVEEEDSPQFLLTQQCGGLAKLPACCSIGACCTCAPPVVSKASVEGLRTFAH